MMTRNDLLNAIIDDGITEVNIVYLDPKQQHKRDGAIAGFEACRGKSDEEILVLHEKAVFQDGVNRGLNNVVFGHSDINNLKEYISLQDYWYHRYYTLQIEWVLNVLSAAYYNENKPVLITPTVRGMIKAANILGVKA